MNPQSPSALQAVRREKGKQIEYDFDSSIFGELREHHPLQFSFLMVHEWLWDISADVTNNRIFDRYLHSRALERSDADGFYKVVKNFEMSGAYTGLDAIVVGKDYVDQNGRQVITVENVNPDLLCATANIRYYGTLFADQGEFGYSEVTSERLALTNQRSFSCNGKDFSHLEASSLDVFFGSMVPYDTDNVSLVLDFPDFGSVKVSVYRTLCERDYQSGFVVPGSCKPTLNSIGFYQVKSESSPQNRK